MGRPRKDHQSATTAKESTVEGTVQVDVESFVRIRDSVVTGLATIQDAISTLSSAYIKHSNAILGEAGASLEIEQALGALQNNPLFDAHREIANAGTRSPPPKEKKKRIHDPNAPKRPLTPYFLYMQTARPIIAADLGSDTPKGQVSVEGVRRWNDMDEVTKSAWNGSYHENLKLYNARMHAYKHGNVQAKTMTDQEASDYGQVHHLGSPAPVQIKVDDPIIEAAIEADSDDDSSASEMAPPPPPVVAPTPKSRNKSKAAAPTPSQNGAVIPPSSAKSAAEPASTPLDTAPGNKRKRNKKGGDEPVASIEGAEEVAETPKPKSRSKKAKNSA